MQKSLVALLITLTAVVPSVSSALISVDLQTGSKGAQVKELQQFLISQQLLTGQPTGNFYSLTQKAVKAYQRSVGISASGYVGAKTRAEINKKLQGQFVAGPSSDTVPPISSSAEIAGLKDAVNKILDQMATLAPTSTIPQNYATSTTQFEFDQKWREAVVNLFCTDRYGGGLSSGSGVIIDSRGIILTNAHVALDFLFQDWPNPSITECVVRTGSPAAPSYKASLVYIPQGYITDTVTAVPGAGDDNFVYGKDDYAILVITGPSTPQVPMPNSFPFMPIVLEPPAVNTPVYLLGYASEYTSYEMLQRSLYQLASPAVVNWQRAIGTSKQIDTIAFNGNVVGQHGSSGGAVVLNGGKLAGLMSFFDKLQGATTAEKVLNAITVGYIARDFQSDTGTALAVFLSTQDLKGMVQTFKDGSGTKYQKMFAKYWKSQGVTIPGYTE